MTFLSKTELAVWGETVAREFLLGKAISILACNFRTRFGEIDIIGKQGERFIFFEVKARQSSGYGYPEEAVTARKLDHIERVAMEYFSINNIGDVDWQVDVISIQRNPRNGSYQIEWIENVMD